MYSHLKNSKIICKIISSLCSWDLKDEFLTSLLAHRKWTPCSRPPLLKMAGRRVLVCCLFVLLCSVLPRPLWSYSMGAPDAACDGMVPGHGPQEQRGPSPYSVVVTKSEVNAGEKVTVQLTEPKIWKDSSCKHGIKPPRSRSAVLGKRRSSLFDLWSGLPCKNEGKWKSLRCFYRFRGRERVEVFWCELNRLPFFASSFLRWLMMELGGALLNRSFTSWTGLMGYGKSLF